MDGSSGLSQISIILCSNEQQTVLSKGLGRFPHREILPERDFGWAVWESLEGSWLQMLTVNASGVSLVWLRNWWVVWCMKLWFTCGRQPPTNAISFDSCWYSDIDPTAFVDVDTPSTQVSRMHRRRHYRMDSDYRTAKRQVRYQTGQGSMQVVYMDYS